MQMACSPRAAAKAACLNARLCGLVCPLGFVPHLQLVAKLELTGEVADDLVVCDLGAERGPQDEAVPDDLINDSADLWWCFLVRSGPSEHRTGRIY